MKKKKIIIIGAIIIAMIVAVGIFFLMNKKEAQPQGELFGVSTDSKDTASDTTSEDTTNADRTILDIHEPYKDGLGTPISPPDKSDEPIAEYEYINDVKHYKYTPGTPVTGGNARYMTEDERKQARESGDLTMISYLEVSDYTLENGYILKDLYGNGDEVYDTRICNAILENEYYNKDRNYIDSGIYFMVLQYPSSYEVGKENITYISLAYQKNGGISTDVSLYRIIGDSTTYWIESIENDTAEKIISKEEMIKGNFISSAIDSAVTDAMKSPENSLSFNEVYINAVKGVEGSEENYIELTNEQIQEVCKTIQYI